MVSGNRQPGRGDRARIAVGLVMLTALAGCQWCPSPQGTNSGGQTPAAALPAGPGAQVPPPGRLDQAQRLKEAHRGQQAMVRCLQSERALTDGNELRCEDWSVIRDEFLRP